MRKDIADKWIADLRAHPELQGRHCLEDDDGRFCCLGRLHVVLGLPTKHEEQRYDGGDLINPLMEVLSEEASKLANMKSLSGELPLGPATDQLELSTLNDDGATFAQIADIIEQYWEDL